MEMLEAAGTSYTYISLLYVLFSLDYLIHNPMKTCYLFCYWYILFLN